MNSEQKKTKQVIAEGMKCKGGGGGEDIL